MGGGKEEGSGRRTRSEDAGHCLFKTRTQHHRMVGKKLTRTPKATPRLKSLGKTDTLEPWGLLRILATGTAMLDIPWTSTGGGGASGLSFQDSPRWLQDVLEESMVASKIAQDSSRLLKIAADTHPRGPPR